jgi:predicted 2-oxoglutarate/Fe(II)-dependent dioxygenase YbiX
VIGDPQLREIIRDRVVRRLLPPIERFFQYQATRMDRTMVCCYDSALGGHFYRHRDNVNLGAQHRRFAVTINLNAEKASYEGGDLRFPEFGTDPYRPPTGSAVVFSCGLLHEVPPVTRGDRFAFLAFLYGEDDARVRAEANAHLAKGERQYQIDDDLLVPPEADTPHP